MIDKKHTVSLVIPNWNGKQLLEKHISDVEKVDSVSEIIIVDDGSDDGSVMYLKERHKDIVVVEKKNHEGFASTVNAGVQKATGDIVVLINTDVVPEKDFLKSLIPHFDDERVFAVGCMDRSHENGKVVHRGRGVAEWKRGLFVHRRGELDRDTTAWVSGGSGAFRRSIWMTLGGMDTLFNPFYWEDIDLSYRALKSGYTLKFEKDSIVDHYHEEGKIKTKYASWYVKLVAYRNQFTFIWKNVSDPGLILSHILWMPFHTLSAFARRDFTLIFGYSWTKVLFIPIFLHSFSQRKFWKLSDRDVEALTR